MLNRSHYKVGEESGGIVSRFHKVIPLQSCWRIQRNPLQSCWRIWRIHYKVGEESGGIVSRFHKVSPTFFSFRTYNSMSTTLVAWIFSRDYLSHKKHLSSFYMFILYFMWLCHHFICSSLLEDQASQKHFICKQISLQWTLFSTYQ